jgi:Mg/Co/Ni transporter MgtE
LTIQKLHIRYEDDYFAEVGKPYSFGILIDQFSCVNSKDIESSADKNLQFRNVRVYWNSLSEMFIPTTLWEQTQNQRYQIFEAMEASQIAQMMGSAFHSDQTILVKSFNADIDFSLQESHLDFALKLSPIYMTLTSQ